MIKTYVSNCGALVQASEWTDTTCHPEMEYLCPLREFIHSPEGIKVWVRHNGHSDYKGPHPLSGTYAVRVIAGSLDFGTGETLLISKKQFTLKFRELDTHHIPVE